MEPRQFIKGVLVGEVKDVMAHHAYLAFPLIGIGIEFLGRALDTGHDWDYSYPSAPCRRLIAPSHSCFLSAIKTSSFGI